MTETLVGTIPLIFLEYIVLPLIAILAALSLKKRVKKSKISVEDFLEDLNIDIKIISALGLMLFALSNFIHELDSDPSGWTLNYCWIGVVVALFCYIYIHQFYQFRYDGNSSHRTIFFGMRNAVYSDSSWFIFVLVCYVLIGMVIRGITKSYEAQNVPKLSFFLTALYFLFSLLCSILCLAFFFLLLNKQTRLFLQNNKAYMKTFNNAFVNEPNDIDNSETIKKYNLIIATVKHNDPILISVYEQLSDIYEKAGHLPVAAKYLDEIIRLLSDKQVNKDEDYLVDAYLSKLDFFKRNGMKGEEEVILAHMMKEFPENEKLKHQMGLQFD